MKLRKCAVCGERADTRWIVDQSSGKMVFGAVCRGEHWVGPAFKTQKHAARAWNECQEFFESYGTAKSGSSL